MNTKYRIIIVVTIIFLTVKAVQHYNTSWVEPPQLLPNEIGINGEEKLKISVYYEALCPDSKFFVTFQLLPVFEEFMDYVVIDLIPYGKAQTEEVDGKFIFHCQHDEVECFANKIHACAIHHVANPMQQIKYIACMITDNMRPADAGEKCAHELNLDFASISECANDVMGSQLLAAHGKRTHSLSPAVRFIPTIELNESQNLVPQSAILKDLRKAVCQVFTKKPPKCVILGVI